MQRKSLGSKLLAIGIGLTVVCGAAILAGTLALKKYLPPEKVRSLIVENAQKTLGREVRLKSVSLNIISGLQVSGLEISEAPDFSKGKFASLGSFSLNVQWLPLLKGKVVINEISLEGLDVLIVKNADGDLNFSDLTKKKDEDSPSKTSEREEVPELPFELAISRADISGAKIHYQDLASGDEVTLSEISAEIRDFTLDGLFTVNAGLKVSGKAAGKPLDAAVDFEGKISLGALDPERMKVEIDRLEILTEGLTLKNSGSLEGAGPATIKLKTRVLKDDVELLELDLTATLPGNEGPQESFVDLSLKTKPIDSSVFAAMGAPGGIKIPALAIGLKAGLKDETLTLTSLSLRAPGGELSASGKILKLKTKPDPRLDLKAKIALPPLTDTQLGFVKGLLAGLRLPASRFEADLKLAGLGSLAIRSLKIGLGATEMEINGQVHRLTSGNPALKLKLTSRRLDLAELAAILPAGREFGVKGSGTLALSLKGTPKKPSVAGNITLKGMGATAGKLVLSGFGGRISFNPRTLALSNMRGKVGAGDLRIDLTVKDYLKAPDINLTATLTKLDLGQLLGDSKGIEKDLEAAAAENKPPKQDPPGTIPIKARGRITINEIEHPQAQAHGLKIRWNITGVTPSLQRLSGTAAIDVAGGEFKSLEEISSRSKIAKALLIPLVMIQKVGSLGGIKLLPDLSQVKFSEISGRYRFRNGVMTLERSRLVSALATINSSGTIDLPKETLNLGVRADVAHITPLEFSVTGTFEKPKTRLDIVKTLTQPVKNLLDPKNIKKILEGKPVKDIFKGLFGK